MTKELTRSELACQRVALLPAKETLFFNFNFASVFASNSSTALNVLTLLSSAESAAIQNIAVVQ